MATPLHPVGHAITIDQSLPRWTKAPDEEADFADWKIDVKVKVHKGTTASNATTTTTAVTDVVVSYSAHRLRLELKSDYFKSIFRMDGFYESHQNSSTIELPSPAVTLKHFETLLDYFYTGKLALDSSNAVAMVYFGDYFGMNSLKARARTFIEKSIADSSTSNPNKASEMLAAYYQDAESIALEDVQKAIVATCAGRPTVLSKDTALSKMPYALQFWRLVWSARTKHSNESVSTTKEWSVNLAHFIELHFNIIDEEIFCEFTKIDSLLIVSPEAAVILMEQEQRLCTSEINDSDGGDLTCLQQRCTEALYDRKTGEWQVSNDNALMQGKLRNLSPTVLESLLLRAMESKKPRDELCIEVCGAGVESANGVYVHSGSHDGKPFFTRRGTYNGEGRTYALYSFASNRYYISVIPEGEEVGTPFGTVFYAVYAPKLTLLPLLSGWLAPENDNAPAPTLRLKYA